ncbi:MAG: NAD-dependent epimerase/dehydratase family protein [Acidimicrobiales bacterium]
MDVLIVGGTSFVGRAIALSALRDHHVTVLNRGLTPTDLPATVERLVGDRSGDLRCLDGRRFDATIDCIAYRPSDVDRLAEALGDRGGHHVHISSVAAYDHPPVGATETTATLYADDPALMDQPVTGATYGPLKAMSERRAVARFDAVAVVRPTYVIGAHDVTIRFPYWVDRARRGGEIAVPGPRSDTLQYIDARDLADFVVHLAATASTAAVHVAGPDPAAGYVETIERVIDHLAPAGTAVTVIDPALVVSSGLASRFPLWPGPANESSEDVDSALALSLGLVRRPLEASVDEVAAWWDDQPRPDRWLNPDEEASLLHAHEAGSAST